MSRRKQSPSLTTWIAYRKDCVWSLDSQVGTVLSLIAPNLRRTVVPNMNQMGDAYGGRGDRRFIIQPPTTSRFGLERGETKPSVWG